VTIGRRYAARVSLVPRWWRSRSVVLRDAVLGVVLALLAFLPPLAGHGTRLGELPHRPADALAVVAALAQTLPLALRRRHPAIVLAVVAAGFAVQELRGYATLAGFGLLAAIYSAGAYQDRFRHGTAGTATAGYVALSVALHQAGSRNRPDDYVVFSCFLAAGWLLGSWMRNTRADEDERRRAAAANARADERTRIARELHDVVTHHVTAMVVQANAARFLAGDPARVTENLAAVSDTGRRALVELRDLLGVLDPTRQAAPRDRLPGLTQLADLVEQTRAAGQPVEMIFDGEAPAMGAGRELTAYRVVQESLTNALKYAAGRPTVVRIGGRASSLDISVTTAGSARSGVGGSGRGLAGLRERLELFGGSLSAGRGSGDEFTVAAHLPAGESA
jgi:signal transduction histidine kinase